MDEVEVAAAGGVGPDARSGADAQRLSRASSRPSARSRRRAASRTCRSSSGSAREFDEQVERGDFDGLAAIGGVAGVGRCADEPPVGLGARAGVPRSDLARHRPRRERSRAELRHVDDVALREGARVPGRVPHRSGRRRVPARAQPRRSRRARRGAPALLRRAHARRGAAVPVPRVEPDDVRRDRLPAAEPVPRRDPGRADARVGRRGTRRGARRRPGRAPRSGGRGRDAPRERARRAPAAPRSSACASATTCGTRSSAKA